MASCIRMRFSPRASALAGCTCASVFVDTRVHTTGHMNSQQLLPRALQNEPRDAGPTNADDFHSSVVREIEPPSGPGTPSGAARRDARCRRLQLVADVGTCGSRSGRSCTR
jgi:hypothetical protein